MKHTESKIALSFDKSTASLHYEIVFACMERNLLGESGGNILMKRFELSCWIEIGFDGFD